MTLARWLSCLLLFLVSYVLGVHVLRFEHVSHARQLYGNTAFSRMTVTSAQRIIHDLVELEFPATVGTVTGLALFKTFGIATISRLLTATDELANRTTASKRAADTSVELEEYELCAFDVWWKYLGDAMEIDYDVLTLGKDRSWIDGLQCLEELRTWSEAYEMKNLVPAISNHLLAQSRLQVLCGKMLAIIGGPVQTMLLSLLSPRLRAALSFSTPSPMTITTVKTLMQLRAFVLRHFFLSRPEFMRKDLLPQEADPATGRHESKRPSGHSWYVSPTFMRRRGPDLCFERPEGYLIEEVGPHGLEGKGKQEMEVDKGKLRSLGSGCPFDGIFG
ncbi:MAG: hypothetical protein M1828_005367 [Chrysothrix sp. TS-e1954]|nr:MAG: hypothetical protein M1828_005367 [Chrysothrix sp. TS-e1954]